MTTRISVIELREVRKPYEPPIITRVELAAPRRSPRAALLAAADWLASKGI